VGEGPVLAIVGQEEFVDEFFVDHEAILEAPVVEGHDAVAAQLGEQAYRLSLFFGEACDEGFEVVGVVVVVHEHVLEASYVVDALVE